jgi:hypothetical protein
VLYRQHRGILYKTFYKTRLEVRGLKHNITKAFPPHHCVRISNNCSFRSYDVLSTINSLSNTILTKKCIKWLSNAVTTCATCHSFLKCYPRKRGHKPISSFHISTHIEIVPSFQITIFYNIWARTPEFLPSKLAECYSQVFPTGKILYQATHSTRSCQFWQKILWALWVI